MAISKEVRDYFIKIVGEKAKKILGSKCSQTTKHVFGTMTSAIVDFIRRVSKTKSCPQSEIKKNCLSIINAMQANFSDFEKYIEFLETWLRALTEIAGTIEDISFKLSVQQFCNDLTFELRAIMSVQKDPENNDGDLKSSSEFIQKYNVFVSFSSANIVQLEIPSFSFVSRIKEDSYNKFIKNILTSFEPNASERYVHVLNEKEIDELKQILDAHGLLQLNSEEPDAPGKYLSFRNCKGCKDEMLGSSVLSDETHKETVVVIRDPIRSQSWRSYLRSCCF